jgi:hypothetical protein
MSDAIVINITEPPEPLPHPCEVGRHRWAWLTSGGQACGYCGTRR